MVTMTSRARQLRCTSFEFASDADQERKANDADDQRPSRKWFARDRADEGRGKGDQACVPTRLIAFAQFTPGPKQACGHDATDAGDQTEGECVSAAARNGKRQSRAHAKNAETPPEREIPGDKLESAGGRIADRREISRSVWRGVFAQAEAPSLATRGFQLCLG